MIAKMKPAEVRAKIAELEHEEAKLLRAAALAYSVDIEAELAAAAYDARAAAEALLDRYPMA